LRITGANYTVALGQAADDLLLTAQTRLQPRLFGR
jgi:hypothetical protein